MSTRAAEILRRVLGPSRRAERLRELLPMPPLEMRELIGLTDPAGFDQPRGKRVFPTVAPAQYESVFDFGSGCGRLARRLAFASAPMPRRYVGIDLHRGMVQWCNENLAPQLPGFSFAHHDVFHPGFNPDPSLPRTAPFPIESSSATLVVGISVFTHLVESQAEYYLDELARVLRPGGAAVLTWFLFDKPYFPMMQEFQNALYINAEDPSNAVIFDRNWLVRSLEARGLRIRAYEPPDIRGFQWMLTIEPGAGSIALPEDEAPFGRRPPPVGPAEPSSVGAGEDTG